MIRQVSYIAMIVCLAGCTLADAPMTPAPISTGEHHAETAVSQESSRSATAWEALAPGLERRSYVPPNEPLAEIVVLCIDPNLFSFRVHYHPGVSLTLSRWVTELPDLVALINVNFFDQYDQIVGLLVTDGEVYGQAYQGFGGTFVVQNGVSRIRSNLYEPYAGEYSLDCKRVAM